MKKICIIITVLFIVTSSISIIAQQFPPAEMKELGKLSPNASLTGNSFFDCNQNCVYGQAPAPGLFVLPSVMDDYGNGIIAMDNFAGIQGSVTGITFWGVFLGDEDSLVTINTPVHFRISIVDILTFEMIEFTDLYLNGQLALFDTIPIYRFDAIFPGAVNLPPEGIVSVAQIIEPGSELFLFYWVVSMEGDLSSLLILMEDYEIEDGAPFPMDLSFCLNKGAVIPLSNWAVFIGILLIIMVFFIRYRKYSS